MLSRVRRAPRGLLVLVVLAFAHALAWVAVQPPLTGADEHLHTAYVQSIAETGDGPKYSEGNGALSTELGTLHQRLYLQAIVLHPEARPAWGLEDRVDELLQELPDDARKNTTGPNTAAANPFLYYSVAAVAWKLSPDRSLPGRILTVRTLTALLLPVTVVLAWLIAAELFAAAWLRPVVAGIVAFNPKLANLAGIVNPDMLLATLGTGCLLAALRLVQRGFTVKRLLALSLTAGGGALTHPRGLYLSLFAVAVVALTLWLRRDDARVWWREQRTRGALVRGGGAFALLFVLVAVAYLWTQAHVGSGTVSGNTPVGAGLNPRELLSYLWQFYFPGFDIFTSPVGQGYGYQQVFIGTFFGAFGSLDVHFQQETYSRLQIGAFLGLVALYTAAVVRFPALRRRWPVVAVCVLAVVGLVGEMHLVSYTQLRIGGNPVITGRYLAPAIVLMAAAMAFVASSLPRRFGRLVGGAFVGLALVHGVGALGVALERYFA